MSADQQSLEHYLAVVAVESGAGMVRAEGGMEFTRAGEPFAFVSGSAAEFKLDPEIAEAAVSTPSTSPSTRGPDWVRLAPDEPSAMDFDRAKAWFLSAWRAASK